MSRTSFLAIVGLLIACSAAPAQWESGSDGSDGAFSPAVSTEVDLSLAASLCDCDGDSQIDDPCRWDCPSPVPGRGVYDAEQWVIVFKYSTVNVPSGATITFNQHPSGAPVVWLATGNVTINGTINLDGEDGFGNANPPIIPYFTRPGPGGFQGGQGGHAGGNGLTSFGFGPGSSPTLAASLRGGDASYATGSYHQAASGDGGTGSIYGNSEIAPLIGGSGGGSYSGSAHGGGGAGAGAILISAPTNISVGATGLITAEGGNSGGISCFNSTFLPGGAGSGGAVRLRSETVNLAAGSQIIARGGAIVVCGCCIPTTGGDGRIRIEAAILSNLGTITGSQSYPFAPSPLFPPSPPQLHVTAVCGLPAPADPEWGIYSAEIELNSAGSCTVDIAGSGMPVGTIVVVRVVPARGNIISVNSTPMVDAGGGLRAATASVTIPGGRSEIQLRANW